MSDIDIDALADEAWEAVTEIGDDTEKLTAEQSADFYEAIEVRASTAAAAIRQEMQ